MSSTADQNILVGIVTLNRRDKLIRTLQECLRQGFHNIVVVDNGSTDGTREFLSTQWGIDKIFTNRNEGGAGGFNRIMRHFIAATRHQWLLMFDDDAYPYFNSDALRDFLTADAHANRPAYAFKVSYPDGSLCEMNRPGMNILNMNPIKALLGDHHIQETTKNCLVDFASFVGILLKRDTVAKSGCVSKEFFIYSDDTYYTLGISSRLGKICYCPEFIFVHDCNRSSRNLLNHDAERLKRDVTNKIVLIREYSRLRTLWVALYVTRQIVRNPKRVTEILHASYGGISADLRLYRNERPC